MSVLRSIRADIPGVYRYTISVNPDDFRFETIELSILSDLKYAIFSSRNFTQMFRSKEKPDGQKIGQFISINIKINKEYDQKDRARFTFCRDTPRVYAIRIKYRTMCEDGNARGGYRNDSLLSIVPCYLMLFCTRVVQFVSHKSSSKFMLFVIFSSGKVNQKSIWYIADWEYFTAMRCRP